MNWRKTEICSGDDLDPSQPSIVSVKYVDINSMQNKA